MPHETQSLVGAWRRLKYDVVALTDAPGTTVATYSYDTLGTPTIWEAFSNGWHNPFLYDGHDGARYDSETGLYWLSVRAYDPTLGRFISRDPLGRAPSADSDQPYVYADNNPLTNVDPSGQWGRRQMFDNDNWTPHPPKSKIWIVHPRKAPAKKKQSSTKQKPSAHKSTNAQPTGVALGEKTW